MKPKSILLPQRSRAGAPFAERAFLGGLRLLLRRPGAAMDLAQQPLLRQERQVAPDRLARGLQALREVVDRHPGGLVHQLQDLAPGQARHPEVALDDATDRRQPRGEVGQPVELVQVAQRAPLRVVAVLAAPPRITPGCLQMALRVAADPYRRPRRRNRKRTDARDFRAVRQFAAVVVDVAKGVGGAFAPPSRVVRSAVPQRAYDQYGRAS